MATIAVVGRDTGVLHRWTKAIRDAGHASTVLIPGELQTAGSPICLFDLGAGADSQSEADALLDALTAEPGIRFVAMVAHPNATQGLRLLRAGVRAYGNRLATPAVLAAMIETVENGEIWAGKQVTDHLLRVALGEDSVVEPAGRSLLRNLTPRESLIAQQVGAGHSNKVIAVDNGISERTVKAHLNAIYRKTGLKNRVQLALEVSRSQDSSIDRKLAGQS